MRDFRRATDNEIAEIKEILSKATERDKSQHFLVGFPWKSTEWFLASLEEGEFEKLFLFWEADAWKQYRNVKYRRLGEGLKDFIKDKAQDPNQWHDRLREILDKRQWDVSGKIYLILIGDNEDGPFRIIDGNHRAVATLWNAWEDGINDCLPTHAWVGISPEMPDYWSLPETDM